MIRIALSKGRILKQTLPLLAAVGIEPSEDPFVSRKLILPTNQADLELVIIRATDVPTYVQLGAADLGVVGKDSLMEHGGDDLGELLDLGIAPCRIAVAAPVGYERKLSGRRLRVATKYVQIAKQFYRQLGYPIELIKLYGSMELAPLVGLADEIVDLVETGSTLKANNLQAYETIAAISCRLIANTASLRLQHQRISDLEQALQEALRRSSD